MTFSKPRYDKDHEWEIVRYTVGEKTVIGGAGKLLSHFKRSYKPKSIMTYADMRFGQGRVYYLNGFKKVKDTSPGYYYCWRYAPPLLSRHSFQKHMLEKKLSVYDPALSEWENMKLNGYDRIWDCGNALYSWRA